VELEMKEDYLVNVLEQYPNWHPQVEHLRQQHFLLHRQLREARDRIAGMTANGIAGREIRRQLEDWMNTYNEHLQQENKLVQDAFTQETGVGE
jgi:hypothetical protein